MFLVFARRGVVCPPVFIELVISTAWEISSCGFERSLTMLVSVTADLTIRRLRVQPSSYAVTNPTNRDEEHP